MRHLMDAGADTSMKVGDKTAVDIALAFELTDILNLLANHNTTRPNV